MLCDIEEGKGIEREGKEGYGKGMERERIEVRGKGNTRGLK